MTKHAPDAGDTTAAGATEAAAQPPLDEEAPKGRRRRQDGGEDDGSLVVDVRANLSLEGGLTLVADQGQVTVPDTPEVRACIAQGYLDLVE